MSGSRLVVICTGSIAAYKACEVVSRLVQAGHAVRVVTTEAAQRFVGAATWEGLTGAAARSGLFDPGAALDHINLNRWADAVVICPATANTLNRLAAGLADDLPGAMFLARDPATPWLAAPAMNPAMWSHPATRAAVDRLGGWGVRFVPVGEGRTACGETGEGRMAEPAAVVAAVEAAVARPARRLRVLVTSGGTAEPIDGVRVLTNTSTGGTGAGVADHLARHGHEVTLLRARHARRPEAPCREEVFDSFDDLDAALARLLGTGRFDAVIHAAAVSDFGVVSGPARRKVQLSRTAKIDSSVPPLLRLRPHPKLVDGLRARSPGPLRVVAFKLTRGATAPDAAAAVQRLFARARPDLVVHNDLARRGEGDMFPADLYRPDGTVAAHCATRPELAAELERRLLEFPASPSPDAPLS